MAMLTPDVGLLLWQVFIILFVLGLVPVLLAFINILRSQFKEPNGKLIWVLVVLFLNIIGAVLYLLIGRNQRVV